MYVLYIIYYDWYVVGTLHPSFVQTFTAFASGSVAPALPALPQPEQRGSRRASKRSATWLVQLDNRFFGLITVAAHLTQTQQKVVSTDLNLQIDRGPVLRWFSTQWLQPYVQSCFHLFSLVFVVIFFFFVFFFFFLLLLLLLLLMLMLLMSLKLRINLPSQSQAPWVLDQTYDEDVCRMLPLF